MPVTVENPVKMEDVTVQKLEEAFSLDCTVEEACLLANISKQTYYNWINSFPEKKERFDELRNNPVLKARQTVVAKLSENYQNAMDYLKRKKKSEFGDNVDVTSLGQKVSPVLVKFIDGKDKDNSDSAGIQEVV